MNLTNLKSLARLYMPGAKKTIINDSNLELILNLGAVDVAQKTVSLKKNTKFDLEASKGEYNLSTIIPDFLCMDKPGVLFYNGTTWDDLTVTTYDWLDKNMPNWRDTAAGTPQRFYWEGDVLGLHPKPLAALSQGAWVYYGRKPVLMSAGGHFPFHQETDQTLEIPHLSVMSDSVLDYWCWKATKALSKDDMISQKAQQNRYEQNIITNWRQSRKNLALTYDKKTRLQGRKVRRGY